MNKQEIEKALEWANAYLEYEKHTKATYEDTCGTGDMSEDERKEIYEAMDSNISLFVTITEVLEQQLTNGWIPVSERLPNREEYCKNDGRFIVTDGSRVYQALFDIYDCKAFCNCGGKLWDLIIDTRPIAWQPLPEPWKGDTQWPTTKTYIHSPKQSEL